MLNKVKTLFNNKNGMTLVEVLVALTILALVLMLSTPLFISSFNAIKTSGDTSIKVYNQSGLMQRILGNTKTGDDASNSGYNIDAVNVPLTVSGDGKTFTANTPAHLVVSNPTNLNAGYESLLTDSISTCFQVFPRELTDDFKEAYLTVAAVGTTFVDDPATSSAYKLYLNHDPSKPLVRGTDYDIKRVESSDPDVKNKVLTVILYGGKKINYSNSPLTFKYGTVTQDISISAPSMIMVGDKDSSGKYYYYVSRGETTDDGKLIVLQREMNDTDKTTNKTTKLTSAMNDVEWVPAENADDYAKVGGKKYGYYIMGGDNGQIRRFWQDATTGNYYWGGDYTYYTDINLNRADSDVSSYYKATNTYSTSVSYKFLARRDYRKDNKGNKTSDLDGYSLVNGTNGAGSTTKRDNNAAAYVRNMYTVTALDGSAESQKAYFYGSDGKLLRWYAVDGVREDKNGKDPSTGPTLSKIAGSDNVTWETAKNKVGGTAKDSISVNGQNIRSQGYYSEWNWEDLGWLKADQNSYYDVYGITSSNISSAGATKASYPITITSVDAIVLGESTKTSYANDVTQYNYDYSDGGAKMAGLSYPSKTYMLYCGYIPSVYDAWSAVAEKDKSTEMADSKNTNNQDANRIAVKESYNFNNFASFTLNSNIARAYANLGKSEIEKNALWLGVFGITPYFTNSTTTPQTDAKAQLAYTSYQRADLYIDWLVRKCEWHDYIYYWPYTNINYAVTGKFADDNVNNDAFDRLFSKTVKTSILGGLTYNKFKNSTKQQNLTNGKIVDITCSYLSHPFALHIAANPSSGGLVFNVSNDKGNGIWSYYYSNRRETVTILDSASTRIPNGENDIPVSLAVGYGQGGTATFVETGDTLFGIGANYPTYINNIMDIGIVYLRAGEGYIAKQQANGMATEEYEALDKTGYKLDSESNYFHQFYYICSKLPENASNALGKDTYYQVKDEYQLAGNETIGSLFGQNHIGNMYGAKYWENNRHIIYRSTDGGVPDRNDHNTSDNGNFNYLRSHPMTDCKVTSVAWGSTWNNYPEAMWGTDNGTVLSWWVDLNGVNASGAKASDYNDQSVEAEFQSYQWIDNCEGKRLHTNGTAWTQTVGAHKNFTDNKDGSGNTINSVDSYDYKTDNKTISRTFRTFLDKASQENKLYEKGYGFVSTLKSINDVAYANDYWVAVGNQATSSPKDPDSVKERPLNDNNLICPALYCGNKTLKASDGYYGTYGGEEGVKAYTGDGQGGSWVNVRYWVDRVGDGVASESNSTYFWKAVKISNETRYNIVQINNLNGVWYATGYYDANNNEQYDQGERAVICWASDPLAACDSGVTGCWTEAVQFYKTPGSSGKYKAMSASEVGAINSVACRDDL